MERDNFLKKILWVLLVIVLVLFGITYMVFRDLKIRNDRIDKAQQEMYSQQVKQKNLENIQKQIESSKDDISVLDSSFIQSGDDVSFIETIEKLAKRNGLSVSIDSLNINDKDATEDMKNYSMTILTAKIKTQGSWIGTYSFLSQLENIPFKIKINKYALLNNTDEKDEKQKVGLWQSFLEIEALKYK